MTLYKAMVSPPFLYAPNDYGRLIYACKWERVKTGDTVASYATSDEQGARKKVLDNRQ
jgi:hypothetical protein